jgi:site-specific DNA-cytosine methylase
VNVLSLFDGISCGQVALNRMGIKYDKYFASEIDERAISITQKNFPNTIQLGDVEDIDSADLPQIDLLIGGSPCQGFSYAGNQLNFHDPRSKLFFEYADLKTQLKPKYFLLENNRMKQEYQDTISEILDVEPIKINSSLLSAQNRARLYWTNIPTFVPTDKGIMLKSIVGDYDGIWVYPRGYNKGGLQSYKGKSPTITTSSWEHNFFVVQNGEKRQFTAEEAEQLQTLPIGYTDGISNHQRFKAVGNGWTVDVIAHIFKGISNGK